MAARHPPHQLLPCRRRFRSEVRGRGARTASVRYGAQVLQMLVRLGGGTLLQTYHKMGLPRPESAPLDARISPQGTAPFQTPHPGHTTGPTVPPRQAQLRSQDATHRGRGHIPPPSTRRARNSSRRCAALSFSSHAASTEASYQPSAPSLRNKRNRRRTQ